MSLTNAPHQAEVFSITNEANFSPRNYDNELEMAEKKSRKDVME